MKRIIMIGGGAGGAGAATKLRRLDEKSEIVIYEKSSYASYSNCGLPYYFAGRIKTFEALILNSVEALKGNYNIDTFVKHEVIDINSELKEVTVKNLISGEEFKDHYEDLVIAAGVFAHDLKVDGFSDADNIFSLKTPDDVSAIDEFIAKNGEPKNIVVVGGGFIGLEIAENFKLRGVENITIVDSNDQLFHTCDRDIASFGHKLLIDNNLNLILGKSVVGFKEKGRKIVFDNGQILDSDLTFVTVGTKVEDSMYKKIGLKIGETKGIIVDEKQRTNLEHIYAVGDLAESFNIFKEPIRVALAAPASRQAVVAANTIYNIEDTYKGSQGSNALSLFDKSIGSVGYTEADLKRKKIKYHKLVSCKAEKLGLLGGEMVYLKLLYDDKGFIFGAQVYGPLTAEKRLTYIAIAMFAKQTIFDLVEYQVAYNPVVDTSFDVINMAGRMARLELSNQVKNVNISELEGYIKEGWQIIDVRNKGEITANGEFPNSIQIPWSKLRENLSTLDKNKKYILACKIGMRSYNATLILKNNGFENVANLLGAYDHWYAFTNFAHINKGK